MIYFVVRDTARWGIDDYLAEWGKTLTGRIETLAYEELPDRTELPAGTYIFTQRDELLPVELDLASRVWDQLGHVPGVRLLNDPRRAMGRYELLHTLHREGFNEFKAVRATEDPGKLQYPVFIREERFHTGTLTDLLQTPSEVQQSIGDLLLRGWRRCDLLVVEFCHTADDQGIFRKYSAYVVGPTIIARSILHSRHWMVKSGTMEIDPHRAREELEYVESNPHADWLRGAMDTAHIEYGRIDYGLKGDQPQAWEINLYPTLVAPSWMAAAGSDDRKALRRPSRELFFRRFHEALEAIDPEPIRGGTVSPTKVPIHTPADLKRRLRADRRRERLRTFHRATTQRLAGWPPIQPLWKVVRPLVSRLSGAAARVSRPS